MADNTVLPSGGGGDTIRTIDRTLSDPPANSPQKTQVVQLDKGGEQQEGLVTEANPMPVAPAGGEMRAQLYLQMLRLNQVQPDQLNGFVPQEVPSFLGGF